MAWVVSVRVGVECIVGQQCDPPECLDAPGVEGNQSHRGGPGVRRHDGE